MKYTKLFELAVKAAGNSHSPYSHFRVGAALCAENGKIYTGCNIENASFSLTNCAERTAVFKAVSEGNTKFTAIAVAGSSTDNFSTPCVPCGACLQVLSEFCGNDFIIVLSDGEHKLSDFLPMRFSEGNIRYGGNNVK